MISLLQNSSTYEGRKRELDLINKPKQLSAGVRSDSMHGVRVHSEAVFCLLSPAISTTAFADILLSTSRTTTRAEVPPSRRLILPATIVISVKLRGQ